MKRLLWTATASAAGMAAAVAARKLTSAVWPGSADPPLDPADRKVSWQQALGWAMLSGVSAGVARMVSRRAAAAGWEQAFNESPPSVPA